MPNRLEIAWTDIGRFAEAVSFARKELFAPVQEFREAHGLVRAGLVHAEQDDRDRRQVRPTLTAAGQGLNDALGQAFADRINGRLGDYSAADIELCIRPLRDLSGQEAKFTEA